MKKRMISAVLTLAMLVGIVPAMPVFAEEEPLLLSTERAGIEGLDEGGAYFTMGNAQTTIDEHGRYILTIYRDGDTSGEASVEVKTVDVSAVYGKDYVMDDDRYTTTATETDGTYLEHLGDDDYFEKTEAAYTQMTEETEALEEEEAEEDENEDNEPQPKSPLAAMKEAQTGEETRDTYETETEPFIPETIGGGFDVAKEMETSSTTTVTFAPNETEKQVIFKILDDNESEGQEMINFILSEPANAAVTEPFTTTIVIEDDEPVEHSKISFTHAKYTAKDGVATITVKREKPLYSYVTAVITSANDTAAAGTNFDAVKGLVEFLPNREETSFEIPVTPSKEDTSFTVELSDLKGGEDGKIMSAEVIIPGDKGSEISLMSASGSGNTRTIKINNNDYKVDYSQDQTIGRIYKGENKQDIIGYYYSPKYFSYGYEAGDSPTERKNGYNSAGDYGELMWHHWKNFRKGWEYADMTYDQRKYQSIYMDYETYSNGTTTSKHGFETPVKPNNQDYKYCDVGGKNSRAIRGPIKLWYDSAYKDGNQTSYDKKPSNNPSTWFRAHVYRDRKYLYDPDMRFYGAILINKEYHIEVEKADEQDFKTPTGTRKLRPGKITTMKTTVWREGTVTFENDAALGEKQKWGELVGYDITCGSLPNAKVLRLRPAALKGKYNDEYIDNNCYFAGTNTLSYDRTTLTFTDELAAKIDENLGGLESGTLGCYAPLSIKPVYEKIPVFMDVFPADDDIGTFDSEYLKDSSTNKLFFGDEISMAATASKGNYISSSYAYKAFDTAGSTKAEITSNETNYEENRTMQLCYRKYEVKPLFTDVPNHIEISATSEILKYYDISNTIAGNKTGIDSLKGKTLLITDGKDSYKPIAGKAYRIELTPKSGVTIPEGKRPIIKNTYNSKNYVNGYAMDFIAEAQYEQNRYSISLESYSGDYEYFSLESKALYTSIALLDNTSPLTNEPAKQNYVRAGAWLVDAKDKNGKTVKKVESAATLTEDDGSFKASGFKAVQGDRISVLISNNNVDQVVYLNTSKSTQTLKREDRSFQELTGSDGNTNTYSEVTKQCIIMDMNPVEMPVKTAYAPYIRNVFMEYGEKSLGSSTTIAIEESDSLICKARVETNNIDVNCVEFILYDRTGASKGEVQAVYEDSEGKVNKAAKYTYRTSKPDSEGFCSATIPSTDLKDGDMLFVRIISNEKNAAGEYLTYPIINVGVRFYTPIKEEEGQVAEVDMSGLGDLPLLGTVASDFDSGKLMYQIKYADPDNMGTSAYVRTIGIAADIASIEKEKGKVAETDWFGSDDFSKWKNGVSASAKKSNAEIVQQNMDAFNPADDVNTMQAEMVNQYTDEINARFPDRDQPHGQKPTDADKQAIARELYEKDAYENNINNLSKKWNITIGAKIMFQLLYAYDYDREEHVFVGGEYLIAASVNVKKTWYKVIYGVPVFMSINGTFSMQVDGAWLAPKYTGQATDDESATAITAKELRTKQNLLNARFRNKNGTPWVQLGADVKWFPIGVGFCGVFDLHGTIKLSIIVRFTFTGSQNQDIGDDKKDSAGGVMIDFSGGIGVSLFVVKAEFQIGRIKQGWGVFNTNGPITEGAKLMSAGDEDEERDEVGLIKKLVPMDIGDEHAPNNDIELMSVLKQKGEPINIRENTMEKISPKAVPVNDEGDLFTVYLSGDKSKDTANASTLKYMIRDHETGKYSDPIAVDDGSAADGEPDILFVPGGAPGGGGGGKVYVAWTSAESPLDNITVEADGAENANLETTKNNLKKLGIYMRVYDVGGRSWDDTVKVVDDAYENTNVNLAWEDGAVAIYYFKRSLDYVNKIDDIVSLTANYNTWAKKKYDIKRAYDTDDNGFVYLGTYAEDNDYFGYKKGDKYTEQLISFEHPKITDPLVADLSSETYTYWYDDSNSIDYSFYAYSVDTDNNLETSSDREIWLQITNVTDGKTYYPVKLDSGKSDVSTPKLTQVKDDLLITWLSDSSLFNFISVKDTLDGLRNEFEQPVDDDENKDIGEGYDEAEAQTLIPDYEDSALNVIRTTTKDEANEPDWYKTAAEAANKKVKSTDGICSHIAEGEFPIITKDFGENEVGSANRHERALGDYSIVLGKDGNMYLFWVQPSDDPDKLGNALYASAYFKRGEDWVSNVTNEGIVNSDKYISSGFSDPVSISDSGLMIDEMSAVVATDSSALILANTYEQTYEETETGGGTKYDYTVNPFKNGPHNLTEYQFVPTSSLEIVDNEIVMSKVNKDGTTAREDYPKAGEKIRFSWRVKNTGLLPSKGDYEKIEVYEGDTLLFTEDETNLGDEKAIFVGDTYGCKSEGTWTVGENINMDNVRVIVTVRELDEEGNTLGEEVSVTRPLQKKAHVVYGSVGFKSYYDIMDEVIQKLNEALAKDGRFDKQYDIDTIDTMPVEDQLIFTIALSLVIKNDYPELVDIVKMEENQDKSISDMFDYIVYVPVRNNGNKTANITADITYVNDELDKTDAILGRTANTVELAPAEPDSGEMTYISIPINVSKDQFDRYGIVRGKINVYDGEETIIEDIDLFLSETGNVNFTLESEGETLDLYEGDEKQLETEAYPFDKRKNMIYSSSDMDVATVDEDGLITATGDGKATIYVTELGTDRTRKLEVNVTGISEPTPTPKHSSGGGSSSSVSSKVSVYNSGRGANGNVSVSKTNPSKGETVTVTVTPDEGYELDKLVVTDKDGNEIEVTKNEDGTFSFVQPSGSVTVTPEFKKIDTDNPDNPNNNGKDDDWWFKDVPETAWYYSPIKEAYDAERMSGMSEDYFEPETDITRGMFAYAIYRREGLPATDAQNKFEDVKADTYYETAIAWATENEIVAGYDDTHYGPDDQITREQMAAILWRYAKFKEYDVSVGEDTNILDFSDALDISEYAIPAIQWAVGDSVITGFEDGTMRPQANANRAQMAAILNKIADMF